MIDDSALFHGTYDPAKARAYYLKNRRLKGRTKAAEAAEVVKGLARPAAVKSAVKVVGQKPNRANTKSRRAELKAQRAALEKRLDHLRDVLKKKVAEAKKTASKTSSDKDAKAKAPETQADKADRNRGEKSKKLTASQKSRKAKQAKEAYEKEHPNTLSDDIEILREQIKDVRAKIDKAIADAKEQKTKANKPQPLARR